MFNKKKRCINIYKNKEDLYFWVKEVKNNTYKRKRLLYWVIVAILLVVVYVGTPYFIHSLYSYDSLNLSQTETSRFISDEKKVLSKEDIISMKQLLKDNSDNFIKLYFISISSKNSLGFINKIPDTEDIREQAIEQFDKIQEMSFEGSTSPMKIKYDKMFSAILIYNTDQERYYILPTKSLLLDTNVFDGLDLSNAIEQESYFVTTDTMETVSNWFKSDFKGKSHAEVYRMLYEEMNRTAFESEDAKKEAIINTVDKLIKEVTLVLRTLIIFAIVVFSIIIFMLYSPNTSKVEKRTVAYYNKVIDRYKKKEAKKQKKAEKEDANRENRSDVINIIWDLASFQLLDNDIAKKRNELIKHLTLINETLKEVSDVPDSLFYSLKKVYLPVLKDIIADVKREIEDNNGVINEDIQKLLNNAFTSYIKIIESIIASQNNGIMQLMDSNEMLHNMINMAKKEGILPKNFKME